MDLPYNPLPYLRYKVHSHLSLKRKNATIEVIPIAKETNEYSGLKPSPKPTHNKEQATTTRIHIFCIWFKGFLVFSRIANTDFFKLFM